MKSYIPITDEKREQMLKEIGYTSMEQLFSDIPKEAMLKEDMNIPSMDEVELFKYFKNIAAMNKVDMPSFLGAGAYTHYVPAMVDFVLSRSEFYTAYTPYQAEISQGLLQAMFEYQSMICALTGMDVTNASVYDGASAAAEAMIMARNIKRKSNKIVVSQGLNPQTISTLKTYAHTSGAELSFVPLKNGKTDINALEQELDGAAAYIYAQPNYFGVLEDVFEIKQACENAKALSIVSCDPISLGLLAPAGEYADICVSEGQAMGGHVSFGGPGLGFIAVKQKYMRNLPGRIIGQSEDENGNRGFLLTLQAREQHIRRDKAASNICSNQALNALGAAVYLALLGAQGIRQTAQASHNNAAYAQKLIADIDGYEMLYDSPYFKEFAIKCPTSADTINEHLRSNGITGGYSLKDIDMPDAMLLAFTENNGKDDIEKLAECLKEAAK